MAMILLLTYLGCHLMIELCLLSLLVTLLYFCKAGTPRVKIYKTHSFQQSCAVSKYKKMKTSISNVKNTAAFALILVTGLSYNI